MVVNFIARPPTPALRPFVHTVWAMDLGREPTVSPRGPIERVLPTGMTHVAFRLSSAPLKIYEHEDQHQPRLLGHCVVGGARSSSYLRDIAEPSHSVGALLYPGVATVLLGAPADELAERHTLIEDLWPRREVESLRMRIAEAGSLELEIRVLEAAIAAKLPRELGLHPAVAAALNQLSRGASIASAVTASGYSHRALIALFRQAVGLTPKLYCRVARVQRFLDLLTASPRPSLADAALRVGFSDQAHSTREFLAITGISPARYRALAPPRTNHVPLSAIQQR